MAYKQLSVIGSIKVPRRVFSHNRCYGLQLLMMAPKIEECYFSIYQRTQGESAYWSGGKDSPKTESQYWFVSPLKPSWWSSFLADSPPCLAKQMVYWDDYDPTDIILKAFWCQTVDFTEATDTGIALSSVLMHTNSPMTAISAMHARLRSHHVKVVGKPA